jgi:NADPH-dependent 2,4-dienoyl-CoA reductase/sulfur reductase-like enzyme
MASLSLVEHIIPRGFEKRPERAHGRPVSRCIGVARCLILGISYNGVRVMDKYDLVVIGGGPGGLMAAKTAAQAGLKTALVERKKRISEIRRACLQAFLSGSKNQM